MQCFRDLTYTLVVVSGMEGRIRELVGRWGRERSVLVLAKMFFFKYAVCMDMLQEIGTRCKLIIGVAFGASLIPTGSLMDYITPVRGGEPGGGVSSCWLFTSITSLLLSSIIISVPG